MREKYREFHTAEEAEAWGRKYFGDWLHEFQYGGKYYSAVPNDPEFYAYTNSEEVINQAKENLAFQQYCGFEAEKVNVRLRNISGWKPPITDILYNRIVSTMDRTIQRYKIPENITVYRYANADDVKNEYGFLYIRKQICDKGYIGAGLCGESLASIYEADEAHRKGYNLLFKIYVPVGTTALYVGLISRRWAEQEIIFPRGTCFQILSIRKQGYRKIVRCKVINQKPVFL